MTRVVLCSKLPVSLLCDCTSLLQWPAWGHSSRLRDVAQEDVFEQKEPPKDPRPAKSWCPFHHPAPHLTGENRINTRGVSREKIPHGRVVSKEELPQ